MWDELKEQRLQELVGRVDDLSPEEYREARELLVERIREHQGGVRMPNSADLIREMREERDLRNIGLEEE